MEFSIFPEHLEDKIFKIIFHPDDTVFQITSYFPFSKLEQKEILSILDYETNFRSIFTDYVSEDEWERTKEQIKKKFNDELFDIDKKL